MLLINTSVDSYYPIKFGALLYFLLKKKNSGIDPLPLIWNGDLAQMCYVLTLTLWVAPGTAQLSGMKVAMKSEVLLLPLQIPPHCTNTNSYFAVPYSVFHSSHLTSSAQQKMSWEAHVKKSWPDNAITDQVFHGILYQVWKNTFWLH